MSRPSTLRQILALRKRFDELIPGRMPGEVYGMIAEEFDQAASTVATKICCCGYYRSFATVVKSIEKERFLKS